VKVVRALYTAALVIPAVLLIAAIGWFVWSVQVEGGDGAGFTFYIAFLAWSVTGLPVLILAWLSERVVRRNPARDREDAMSREQ